MYGCVHFSRPADPVWLGVTAECFSPNVEILKNCSAIFDLRGLGKLMGAPAEIASAIAGKFGACNVAVAPSRDSALAAARGLEGITIIPYGEEARVLGPLPLDVLEPGEVILETLAEWGVHTFAQFAALPDKGIAERLGSEGIRLQKLARGFGLQPLVPYKPPPAFEASLELDHPLELLEPLSFLLSRLLREICAKLELYGVATNEIELDLGLEHNAAHVRRVRLPVASRDSAWFVKLLQYDLEAHPPHRPITSVRVAVEPVPPRRHQTGLFVPQGPQPERLEVTIARLAAALGEENIGSPELLDTHRPGAFRMMNFRMLPTWKSKPIVPHVGMRIFRPPLHASVEISRGQPQAIVAKHIRGRVACCGGPWRSSGDWWRRNPWNRDDWDIVLQNGAMYRIYNERHTWYVEANYD